jgi:hypothetical protein
MPATYTLIDSEVLTSSQASVTFSAIPATYTDLVLKMSMRGPGGGAASSIDLTFNGTTANYSKTQLRGDGTTADSFNSSNSSDITLSTTVNQSGATANTFSNAEIYIPNYTVTSNKPISVDSATENNATEAYRTAIAGLSRNTAAITSITITANLGTGSSFYLYGISNA